MALAAAMAAALALWPQPVSAHSSLISARPQPGEKLQSAPGVVVLTFSQPLNLALSRASVNGPSGQHFVETSYSSTSLDVPVASNNPGVYTVQWTTVSAVDGHTLNGSFRFGVGVSPGAAGEENQAFPAAPDLVVAGFRGLEYAALLAGVGMLVLLEIAGRRRLAWVRPPISPSLAVAALAGLTVVAGESALAAQGLSISALAGYLAAGPPGWARVTRVAAELLAATVAIRRPRIAALPLLAAALSLAASGHAAAARPPGAAVAVDTLHLTSAGVWAGGILALALLRPPGGWRGRSGLALLAAFSPIALAAFALTAATGVVQALEEVGSLRALVESEYGVILDLKVSAVVLMLPLSILAWRRIRPAPRFEAGLALLVVAATALLSAFPLPPARLEEARASEPGPLQAQGLPHEGDLTLAATAGTTLVGLTLRPATPGSNTAWIYLVPLGGDPAAGQLDAAVRVNGRPALVRRCGPSCRSARLELTGGEEIEVRVTGGTASTAAFTVPALPAPDARSIISQLQDRMHRLTAYRIDELLGPSRQATATTYTFEAPDRMRMAVSTGYQAVFIGGTRYWRDSPKGGWVRDTTQPLKVPSFAWDDAPISAPRLVGHADLDGQSVELVSFYEDVGGAPVWFKLWVADGGLVLHAEMRAQGHFMDHGYHDFDRPLGILAPIS